MGVEIERKFLVDAPKWWDEIWYPSYTIKQGYLFDIKHHTLRVRWTNSKGSFLTYKGPSTADGLSRREDEISIPGWIAKGCLMFCKTLTKVRSEVYYHGKTWEVDYFPDSKLLLAEVELDYPEQMLMLPDWVADEVTGDPAYYNSTMVKG